MKLVNFRPSRASRSRFGVRIVSMRPVAARDSRQRSPSVRSRQDAALRSWEEISRRLASVSIRKGLRFSRSPRGAAITKHDRRRRRRTDSWWCS